MKQPKKITAQHLAVISQIAEAVTQGEAHEALRQTTQARFDKVLTELSRQPALLSGFFAAVELAATAKTAALIATHHMRPAEVTRLVEDRKAEIAAEKEARNAAKKSLTK